MEKFIGRSNTPTTRELLKQHIDCLFDKFIFSNEYNIWVEVNI